MGICDRVKTYAMSEEYGLGQKIFRTFLLNDENMLGELYTASFSNESFEILFRVLSVFSLSIIS